MSLTTLAEGATFARDPGTSLEGAEEFVREDPFVLHGVVARHELLPWDDMFD